MKKSENKSGSNLLKGSLIAGALFSMTALSAAPISSLYSYEVLGSGAELRSEILNSDVAPNTSLELNCGEKETKKAEKTKKSGEKTTKEATKEAKSKEAKCGESSCGEKAKETKKETKKEAKAAKSEESKTKEAKCGEGKCGDN